MQCQHQPVVVPILAAVPAPTAVPAPVAVQALAWHAIPAPVTVPASAESSAAVPVPENVWIQMFHRGSLSVLLKSKKLFGEGDVGYAMWVMGKFLRLGKFSMREIVKVDNL